MSKNYIAEGAVVKGKVQMGEDVSIWYNATVRGDSAEIKIGDRTNVQDNAVIHVDTHYPNGSHCIKRSQHWGELYHRRRGSCNPKYKYSCWKPCFWQSCQSHPLTHARRNRK